MASPSFYIITGLSGAGKSQAMRHFEDFGFYCVDNLPPKLVLTFAELCQQSQGDMERVALLIDVRSDDFLNTFLTTLDELDARGFKWQMLYLEASNEELLNRFRETRRRHPLMDKYGSIPACIEAEREVMRPVRLRAQRIVDTTGLSAKQLKVQLGEVYAQAGGAPRLRLAVQSFGFKHGLPRGAELLFDVRPLPNPYYEPGLKDLTGLDAPVRDFIFADPRSRELLERIWSLVEFMLPLYEEEGRMAVAVALGCTGGRHRSVVLAAELAGRLEKRGYHVTLEHRDLRVASAEAGEEDE